MKFTSAIFLLVLIAMVLAMPPTNEPKKRSISVKRSTNCYYNNTFLGCETQDQYLSRNNQTAPSDDWEFLDEFYHYLKPGAGGTGSQAKPHRDSDTFDFIEEGAQCANKNYTMKMFVLNGHIFLGFWPQDTSCTYGYVLDTRIAGSNSNNERSIFPFFRPAYHTNVGSGLVNVSQATGDIFDFGIVNISLVFNHLAARITAGTFYTGRYDSLVNNCGANIIPAVLSTGNFFGKAAKAFVVSKLVQSSGMMTMYAHPRNTESLWPELDANEREELTPSQLTDTAYKWQSNKNQPNPPSCTFSVASSINRDCRQTTLDGILPGDVTGDAYTLPDFCTLTYSDSPRTSSCETITRTITSTNLKGVTITDTQQVVISCPVCIITPVTGVRYTCEEDSSVIRSGDEASGDSNCNGALSNSDSTSLAPGPVCGFFTRTWSGVDYCGTAATATESVEIYDEVDPTLICQTGGIDCPDVIMDDDCPSLTTVSVTASSVQRKYTVTDKCGNTHTGTCNVAASICL